MTTILYFLLILFSGAVSFLFSGIEAGVLSINRIRIRQQMREGQTNARILFNYYREPEKFYWTILLGNIFANAIFVIVLVLLLENLVTNLLLFWIIFLIGFFSLFTFCDLLPKTIFRKFPNRLCLITVKPFRFIQIVITPFVSIVHKIFGDTFKGSVGQPFASRLFRNREELKALMEESDESLSESERFMINQVLYLNERTLEQVAIPIALTITASADCPISKVVELCRTNQIGRIPIWKFTGGKRKIIGIITLKTSLYKKDYDENKTALDYLQPALFLPSNLKAEAAIKRMQRSGHWLAIMTNDSQNETGIVSLKDLLKVVFKVNHKPW